jgi:trans-aconitate methyltransferase
MRAATNWDRYYRRIKISQITLGVIWKAYVDLLSEVQFGEPVKIIELGCGTGYNTLQLTKLFPASKVTLVDANPNVLTVAEKKLSRLGCEKEFLLQDLFGLDLSEKYDIAHSQGLLEHYPVERRRELIHLHRELLTESGVAVIIVPTPSLVYRLWRGMLEMMHLWIYTDETAITRAEFGDDLEASNMQILKMRMYHLTELGALCKKKNRSYENGIT